VVFGQFVIVTSYVNVTVNQSDVLAFGTSCIQSVPLFSALTHVTPAFLKTIKFVFLEVTGCERLPFCCNCQTRNFIFYYCTNLWLLYQRAGSVVRAREYYAEVVAPITLVLYKYKFMSGTCYLFRDINQTLPALRRAFRGQRSGGKRARLISRHYRRTISCGINHRSNESKKAKLKYH